MLNERSEKVLEETVPPIAEASQPAANLGDRVKDGLEVAWSFTQLLLKKAPIVIDTNPVKVAFGVAQIALELKKVSEEYELDVPFAHEVHQGMQDNMDATERQIVSSLQLLCTVSEALQSWHGQSPSETRAMEAFKSYVRSNLRPAIPGHER